MARFLISVWPLRSHYYPLIPVAHALKKRGHEVAFYTGPSACDILKEEGFECFPFTVLEGDWIEKAFYGGRAATSWKETFRFRRFMHEWLVGTAPAQIKDMTDIAETWRPDVIVSETSMWGPMLVLHETLRLPVAVFSTVIACLLPGPGAPPYGIGLRPARTWVSRCGCWFIARIRNVLAGSILRAAQAIRGDHGLAPIRGTVTEHAGRMPLYIIPGIPEFDYNRDDLPESVHYVGPCVWNRTRNDAAPAWLHEMRDATSVVHITEGTMRTEEPLLLRSGACGLAGLPMQVIMTTGGHRDAAELGLGDLASNIRLESYIAHSDLLPHTDVVVTTGGAGTVSAALQAGVPLVVVPTVTDQPENARRVEEAGAGVYLRPSKCTPDGLRQAVERVLGDPSYRRNAERLGRILAKYDGPERAATLLEELARTDAKDLTQEILGVQ